MTDIIALANELWEAEGSPSFYADGSYSGGELMLIRGLQRKLQERQHRVETLEIEKFKLLQSFVRIAISHHAGEEPTDCHWCAEAQEIVGLADKEYDTFQRSALE